jgi:sugar lactone lactonase YvrE
MGRNAEKGAGAIYRFWQGELRQLYTGVTIPNAICFSPDGATAYFTDTSKAILHRVAIDPANALPTGNAETLYDHRGGVGGLDGAVVDQDGLIWNARWGGSCIDVYTPGGDRVRNIRVSAKHPPGPPTRTMAGRSFSTSARAGGRNPGSGWGRYDGPCDHGACAADEYLRSHIA